MVVMQGFKRERVDATSGVRMSVTHRTRLILTTRRRRRHDYSRIGSRYRASSPSAFGRVD